MQHGTIDPRTPVIVGVGQHNQRVDRGADALEPTALMAEALRLAEAMPTPRACCRRPIWSGW